MDFCRLSLYKKKLSSIIDIQKVKELIYINNGSGIFNQYDSKNLYVDGIKPYQIFPYMRNNKLHFMGFSYNPNPNLTPNNIDYKDGGVPIIFYDIEMDL